MQDNPVAWGSRRTFLKTLAGAAAATAIGVGFDFDCAQLADEGIEVKYACQALIGSDCWAHRWSFQSGQDQHHVDALFPSRYPTAHQIEPVVEALSNALKFKHPGLSLRFPA